MELDCLICQRKLSNPTLPNCCGHLFCGPCIWKWMRVTQSCPECKLPISSLTDCEGSEKSVSKAPPVEIYGLDDDELSIVLSRTPDPTPRDRSPRRR